MSRNRLLDSILLMVLLIGVSSFPVDLITNDIYIYYAIEIGLQSACLLFIYFYARRYRGVFPELGRFRLDNLLLLLPLLLVTFSNFIYAWILQESPLVHFEWYNLLQIIFIGLVVVNEELVFRHMLLGNLNHNNVVIRILISAAIFALCHLTRFFSTLNPYELISIAYTFGLGILLGFIYCYTNSLVACIVFHFLFNGLNDFLFTHIYLVSNSLWYYLINAIVAVIVGVYLLLVYLLKFKEKTSKSWMN